MQAYLWLMDFVAVLVATCLNEIRSWFGLYAGPGAGVAKRTGREADEVEDP